MTTQTSNTCSSYSESMCRSFSVVCCGSGGHRFAVDAAYVKSVTQLAAAQADAELDEISNDQGTFPVVSLSRLIATESHQPVRSGSERFLILVGVGDQQVLLRAENISLPIKSYDANVFPMPAVARLQCSDGMINDVAVLKHEDLSTAGKSSHLFLDLEKAFGFAPTETEQSEHQQELKEPPGLPMGTPSNRGGSRQLLVFGTDCDAQQAGFSFCLPVAAIAEITNVLPMWELPWKTQFCAGYALWRDVPVPIINLGGCFGLNNQAANDELMKNGQRLIIARASNRRYVGFTAGKHLRMIKVPSPDTTTLIEQNWDKPSLGAFETEQGCLVVPDLNGILQSGNDTE